MNNTQKKYLTVCLIALGLVCLLGRFFVAQGKYENPAFWGSDLTNGYLSSKPTIPPVEGESPSNSQLGGTNRLENDSSTILLDTPEGTYSCILRP